MNTDILADQLQVSFITPSSTNPRKTFDPAADKELLESVKARGVVTPIIVRPVDGQFEIVDGERRWRAAKAAGLGAISCIIREYTSDEAFEVQLISFAQRADVHPLDEAAAYQELAKKNFDIAQIALKVGKARSFIARRLQLVTLIEPVKEKLRKGSIPLGHALEIARLDPEAQKEIAKRSLGDNVRLVDLRESIARHYLLNLDGAPFKKDDAALVPKAGACTSCPMRAGNSPDLFDDIRKGNTCTDRSCFYGKIEAFIASRIEAFEAGGKQLMQISKEYYDAPKGSLSTEKYRLVEKSRATGQGIFVDGPRIGQVVPIQLAGERNAGPGDKHEVCHLSEDQLKERYKRRLEIFGNRVEQAARVKIYKALIARMKWPLDRKEFEVIVKELLERSDYDGEIVGELIGMDPQKTGLRRHLSLELRKLTDQQLVQIAFAVTLYQDLIKDPTLWQPDDDHLKALLDLDKNKNVDAAKIRKECTMELAAKKPKSAKAEKKSKTRKKDKKTKK